MVVGYTDVGIVVGEVDVSVVIRVCAVLVAFEVEVLHVTPLSLTKKFCDRQCNLVYTFVSFTDMTYTDKKSV